MKLASWIGSVIVGAALLTGAKPASASLDFLGPVTTLGWTGGDCSVCHSGPLGMAGTATQPFAKTLVSKGLKIRDVASFNTAIDNLGDADSDGDGTGDLEELMTHQNPSVANGGAVEANEPVLYGCFNSVVARRDVPANGLGMFAGLLTAVALWRTRRRPR